MVRVVENTFTLMEQSMLGNSRMGNIMVKEHILGLMETSMRGNTRMGNVERNIIRQRRKHQIQVGEWRKTIMKHLLIILISILLLSSLCLVRKRVFFINMKLLLEYNGKLLEMVKSNQSIKVKSQMGKWMGWVF